LRNIKTIGFTPEGGIQLDQHRIILRDGQLWLIKTPIDELTMRRFQPITRPDDQFYTRSIKWPNGSRIILDSRGFLKLSRPKSPAKDFTIALIIGQELAACANIGYYAGNPYFFNARVDQVTTPTDFHRSFIVPFINALDKP
jgi:MoxR-vWA-beta-propeller ternary system domain bpX1